METINTSRRKTISYAKDGRLSTHVWIVNSRNVAYTLGFSPLRRWEPVTGTVWDERMADGKAPVSMSRADLAKLIRRCRARGYETLKCRLFSESV